MVRNAWRVTKGGFRELLQHQKNKGQLRMHCKRTWLYPKYSGRLCDCSDTTSLYPTDSGKKHLKILEEYVRSIHKKIFQQGMDLPIFQMHSLQFFVPPRFQFQFLCTEIYTCKAFNNDYESETVFPWISLNIYQNERDPDKSCRA